MPLKKNIKESIESFNDPELIDRLIFVSLDRAMRENEVVGYVVNIFYNVIKDGNINIINNFVISGIFIVFFERIIKKK